MHISHALRRLHLYRIQLGARFPISIHDFNQSHLFSSDLLCIPGLIFVRGFELIVFKVHSYVWQMHPLPYNAELVQWLSFGRLITANCF